MWSRLPTPLLGLVFACFTVRQHAATSNLVCRSWHEATPLFKKYVLFPGSDYVRKETLACVRQLVVYGLVPMNLLAACHAAETVHLNGFDVMAISKLLDFQHLRHLQLDWLPPEIEALFVLAERLETLTLMGDMSKWSSDQWATLLTSGLVVTSIVLSKGTTGRPWIDHVRSVGMAREPKVLPLVELEGSITKPIQDFYDAVRCLNCRLHVLDGKGLDPLPRVPVLRLKKLRPTEDESSWVFRVMVEGAECTHVDLHLSFLSDWQLIQSRGAAFPGLRSLAVEVWSSSLVSIMCCLLGARDLRCLVLKLCSSFGLVSRPRQLEFLILLGELQVASCWLSQLVFVDWKLDRDLTVSGLDVTETTNEAYLESSLMSGFQPDATRACEDLTRVFSQSAVNSAANWSM